MHKKILSMILALVMVLGLLPATFATPVSAPANFEDMKAEDDLPF